MAISWRWLLVVPVVLAGMLLAACGGDGEEPSPSGPADEGVATMEPAEDGVVEEEPTAEGGGAEVSGAAFEDVPVPSGANETDSGEWSGSIPGLVPGVGAEPGDFTSVEYKQLEVDDSPSDVISFYQDNMGGWNEEFVYSGGETGDEGSIGIWTKDDGRTAVWITASSSDGATQVVIIRGSSD